MKRPRLPIASAVALSAVVAACGGPPPPGLDPSSDSGGELSIDDGDTSFFVDPHFGGEQPGIQLEEIRWGRLVDVYDEDPASGARTLQFRDYLVGANVESGDDLTLESSPLTQRSSVVIHHPSTSSDYARTFEHLTAELDTVDTHDAVPGGLLAPTMVPRNAALSLRFSDLLDESSLARDTVQVSVGSPFGVRILVDRNHGGVVETEAGPVFHPTRILLDPTVSETETLEDASDLAPNGSGFPESPNAFAANVLLHFPTREDASSGQFRFVSNLGGHGLDPGRNGPVDAERPTLPVVRAFRSGGRTSITGDPHNGFLPDDEAPRLLGSQAVVLRGVRAGAQPDEWLVDLEFQEPACASTPRAGDLLEFPDLFAEFLSGAPELDGATVEGAPVRVFGSDIAALEGLHGLHVTAFDRELGHDPACFVTLRPEAAAFPLRGVSPDLEITLRFSEPMDPVALNGLEGITVTRTEDGAAPDEVVVAQVDPAPDLHTYTWRPALSLSHVEGTAEEYYLHAGLSNPLIDLAGNAVADALPRLALALDPGAPTDTNGGFVLRFDAPDEDGDGLAELRGQFLHQEGRIVPRPVSRFSMRADRDEPIVGNMQNLPHAIFASPHDLGVTAPLNPLGSRVMTVWRRADLGLGLQTESLFNLDVEGLAWAPRFGLAQADFLSDFSIALAHSARLPDEAAAGAPHVPDSGLLASRFSDNVLEDPASPPKVVHERHEGYLISPADSFETPGGEVMAPFPLNRGKDPSEFRHYTWRDTAIQRLGGTDGLGLPIGGLVNSGDLPTMDLVGTVAPPGAVPSIGLPLLIDFKNWPGSGAGNNTFDVLLGGFPTLFGFDLPTNFRVHSTGGVDTSGHQVQVDPDALDVPKGGFHTVAAIAPVGTASNPDDSLFYVGQVDFVVRVSRAHSVWIDSGGHATWGSPVTVPAADQLPAGTEIEFAYRGAELVTGVPLVDALALDAYGDEPVEGDPSTYGLPDFKNPSVSFATEDDALWSRDTEAVKGSRYVQNRITFVSNAATGETPELRAVGFVWDVKD